MPLKEIPIGVRFEIKINYNGRRISYPIIKTWDNAGIEHFMLLGSQKVLLLQSNRPLLRTKGLKHKRIEYKLLFGDISYQSLLEDIMKAIDSYITNYELTHTDARDI
jgi:hypothetical protein